MFSAGKRHQLGRENVWLPQFIGQAASHVRRRRLAGRAAAFAAGSRAVYQRAGALFLVLARAAPADQATADLWRSAREARLADCRDLVRLAAPSAVADDRTVDVVFVLSGPGVYADLTGDRGWPAAAYEQWLTTALEPLLGH